MSECTHNCSTCSANCSSRESNQIEANDLLAPQNAASNVKRVIGVVSGKGGVGKSTVTCALATLMNRRGYKTAVLDADITGPSVPRAFGLRDVRLEGSELEMFPAQTKMGISVVSTNLLLDEENKPVVWRGPVIAGMVKQFWTDTCWNEVDYMFVDMPPGTGDVPLTVFQSLPLDGIVIVTSPQQLVSMIVDKAVNMAKLMNVRILGIVENMSSFRCPDCGKEHRLFGDSGIEEFARERGVPLLAKVPMDPELSSLCDKGLIELMENTDFDAVADAIENATK
ncbi:MAG: Mrp/NBP35 family ATP-binding protein [Clostridia bacterium]|nr:Mrp/NBP35 family ATP-binding protein [Clostridia bacterium]